MKVLLKITLVLLVCVTASQAFSQSFGLNAGLNLSKMRAQINGEEDNVSSEIFNQGFHIGPTANFPLTEYFSFETGLLLSTKGYKVDDEINNFGTTFKIEASVSPIYIELPLATKFTYDLNGPKVYALIGPYIAYGISGKSILTIEQSVDSVTEENEIMWGSEPTDDLKNLDYGITAGAGMEIIGLQIGLNYGYGLANVISDTSNDAIINNRVLGITIGYKL